MTRSPFRRKLTPKNVDPIGKAKRKRLGAGKKTKANIVANKKIDAVLIDRDIRFCQLCGSSLFLQRSHDKKRRFLSADELNEATLLCDADHKFIEYKLNPAEQEAVNFFLRDQWDAAPAWRFEKVCKMIRPEMAVKWKQEIEKRKF